jgi:hypothetical protein
MPVLLAGLDADDVARPDLLDLGPLALHPAAAVSHDQRLTQRGCVCQAVRAPGSNVTRAAPDTCMLRVRRCRTFSGELEAGAVRLVLDEGKTVTSRDSHPV